MEGEFEKNEACYNVFQTEVNGRAMKSFPTVKVHKVLWALSKL